MTQDPKTRPAHDLPSTETPATPKPPAGQDIKALVTPGDDAEQEAQAEDATDGDGQPDADH